MIASPAAEGEAESAQELAERALAAAAAVPVVLDGAGRLAVHGAGQYN